MESPSDYLSAGCLVFGGTAVGSNLTTIEVGKESDTSPGSKVDFSGESSDSVVDPVLIQWGELVS